MSTEYGHAVNGVFVHAPNPLQTAQGMAYHPTGEIYAAYGYLPKVQTDAPEQVEGDATVYDCRYVERDGACAQEWYAVAAVEPVPTEPPVPTLEERVAAVESEVTDVREAIGAIFGEVSA